MTPSRLLAFVVSLGCLAAQDLPPAPPGVAIPVDRDPVTTASGLRYTVLTPGAPDGERPRVGDRVRVHYTGWLKDGTQFDSSRGGQPAEFLLGRVIGGWNEGVALMTKGARFKLTIPPALGYGAAGAPPTIPGDATLMFDVELLDFVAGPRFVAIDGDKAKSTESGLRHQVLAAGEGDALAASDRFELRYGVWTPAGEFVLNYLGEPRPVRIALEQMSMAFMKELVGLLKTGGRCVAEVPVEAAFPDAERRPPTLGDAKLCVWQFEVVRTFRPMPVPEFKASDADKLKKTASGLAYETLREGTGKTPTADDVVQVHYVGWLEDGKVFDSSYASGEEAEFPLRGVIDGWTEGLQLMKEGGMAQFVIPAALAYGAEGRPPVIPAGATLVFRIELITVR